MSIPETQGPRKKRSVLVVEDFPMVRTGLVALLERDGRFEVCGQADNATSALSEVSRTRPELICMDLRLGDADGFDLIREIKALHPPTRILVISMHKEDLYAERSLAAGASGYLMKSEAAETVLKALNVILDGRHYVSPRISMELLNRLHRPEGRHPGKTGVSALTDRELQIFQLIGLGHQTRDIASRLGIGIKTVESHRENIKNKLGLEHATALVREATVWVQQQRGQSS